MPYRTLLTVIYSSEACAAQIAAGAQLARRLDAHLDILCLGIDEVQVGYYFAGADAVLQQTSIAMAREKAEALQSAAEAAVVAEDVRWSAQAMVTQFGVLTEVVARAAMFSDLVVQPLPLGDLGGDAAVAIVEAALFAGQSPVLLLPAAELSPEFPRRAVVGWNSGVEAMSAVRAALPALKLAGSASVAMIDPPLRAADQSAPGQRLCTMLDRHGIRAEVALLPKTKPRVSDVLMDHVEGQDADLLVTGAYGHSRFREAILGGATRELMSRARVPLLMAH
ncbi:universal stress protein [Meridianimarinicoccus roseus]|uniref:Universal stress protein n=1 Tax=Meridianimarinicoccus roseus TaxID=2072018 RepID=A0A2V2L860_9RHOB|nr:universal stress protein [Meridianimarinicoccus roseus]PWR01608.1 universal stress protein [Meridianimarinicoccus roseus]